MSVQLVTANIVFSDSFTARPNLQRGVFISRHNYFSERYREYQSLNALTEDGIPTTSAAYIAAQGHFSQDPALSVFGLGRFETTSIIAPEAPQTGLEYSLTLNAKDAVEETTFTYTALSLDTAEDVAAALKGLIDAQADIAAKITTTVVGVGADAVLELSHAVVNDWFTVKGLINVTESFPLTPENNAATEMGNITTEYDNFYYITTDVKDSAYVQALATDIAGRFNFYAVSLAEEDAYTGESTGTFKDLIVDKQYLNVYPIYHHEAETKYPEVAAMSEAFAVIDTGVTFANRSVVGVGTSLAVDGTRLTGNQISNMQANGINFFSPPKISGSTSAQRLNAAISTGKNGGGRVASGEYAFNIVGKDALTVEIEANVTDLLISQKTGRLSWIQEDLDKVYGQVDKALIKFANPDGWNLIYNKSDKNSPYVISRLTPKQFSPEQRQAGFLDNMSFTAYLTDAIHLVDITGNLTRPS